MHNLNQRFRVLLVGHLTVDRFQRGERFGGSVLYVARALRGSGYEVTVVTSGPATAVQELEALGCCVHVQPARQTTTFDFDELGAGRQLCCRTVAAPLVAEQSDLKPSYDLLALVPVAGECGEDWLVASLAKTRVLGLQGWLREFTAEGAVLPQAPPDYLWRYQHDGLVCSESEFVQAMGSQPRNAVCGCLAVTRGPKGATLFDRVGLPCEVPTIPLSLTDDVGAGDAFTAGFATSLMRGLGARESVMAGHQMAGDLLSRGPAEFR